MKKLLLATTITVALAGCSSTQTVEQTQTFANCTFPDAPAVEAPAWICDVMPKDLAAGATGHAKKSVAGMSVMRKVAINNARVDLASQFQVDINNMFKQAIEATTETTTALGANERVQETFESITKNVTTRALTNSHLIVSQASPSGGLYVLVGMDQAAYDMNVNKVVDEVKNEDSALWDKFNNEKAAKELAQALESLKR
ncbi:lipoprotein [Photobacterium indicum]|uniref:Type IV secretion system putative lipoprotein virB7 n=1 Tax=Photobacterium indicum TaxID=81447 RepID=A0A2T3LA96_9GAMM|nr:lipoprotein [Photobacterium indicum]PSV48232.1 hypothetical protein C9J47_06770 [Photobacterium indicum]